MNCSNDFHFMSQAIRLAKKGLFTSDPNPNVGCVIVRQQEIIAEGWHARAGQGHAEVEALKQCTNPEGTTVYVSLEPCSHFGKTPPCCDALIEAGVKRVVVAMQDPNPLVAGQGLARLRAAGIDVECGLLETEAQLLNPGFIKRMQTGEPYLISKMAMSLDGRTAMASGESQWITSAPARQDVHRLRAASSAVLTGVNTVLADDCSLTARLEDIEIQQPVRVILDSKLQTPCSAKMASLPGKSLIFTCMKNHLRQNKLEQAGFQIYSLPANDKQQVDLASALKLLGDLQINQVLVEAGPTLNGALLSGNCVDKWIVYMAPSVMGHAGRALFNTPEMHFMRDKVNLEIDTVRQVGPDLKMIFKVSGQ